jgi:hypothetical protein
VTRNLRPAARDAWTNARDFFKKRAPYLLTNFQLAEQFGDRMPALRQYVKVADRMRVEATQQQMAFDAVATRWDALPGAARAALDGLAMRVTRARIHPDLPLDDPKNAHATPAERAQYDDLARDYRQMANSFPAAARVYHEALQVQGQARERMEAAATALFEHYGVKRTAPREMPGPYFPLMRFGDYLAIGESAALKQAADDVLAWEPGHAVRAKLQERLEAMRADPAHYRVSAHESRAAMERAASEYARDGLEARTHLSHQRLGAMPRDVHQLVQQMAGRMAERLDPATAEVAMDTYKEMLLQGLPENHALMRAAQRQGGAGVEGASPDALRAFAASGRKSAFYTARLMHAQDSAAALLEMKRTAQARSDTDAEHVVREMEQRAALDLQFQDTPIQDAVGTLGWTYYLGVSPTFLMMNMTQPWLVTAPVLAGKYGAGRSLKALATASREALAILRGARWKDGRWSPWEGISEETVATTRTTPGARVLPVSEDRKALRELMQRGIVDEGLSHEMRTFAEGGSRTMTKWGRWMGWASQQIELVNRTATALAAFRLARGQGMSYEAAVDEAYRVTTNTQVDYSAEGTARFMRQGGGIPLAKLIFQFRRYQQTMLYVLGDNIKKLASPAERRTAAKSLAYFALSNGLAAGALGLPFAGTMLAMADLFMDDDDERGDAQTRLRNLLTDLTGDAAMAQVLAKGIPAAFGADLSGRLGMGDIATMYPRLKMDARTSEDNLGRVLTAVSGPAGGLANQALKAADFFGAGDWMKGTEQLLPKFAADPLRALRMATQGLTDAKGESVLPADEISAWDKTLRALGTTPVGQADMYEAQAAGRGVEEAVTGRKAGIQRQFRHALREGDFSAVRQEIEAFNEDHPGRRITPREEMRWRKEAAQAARERAGAAGPVGVRMDRRATAEDRERVRFAPSP